MVPLAPDVRDLIKLVAKRYQIDPLSCNVKLVAILGEQLKYSDVDGNEMTTTLRALLRGDGAFAGSATFDAIVSGSGSGSWAASCRA